MEIKKEEKKRLIKFYNINEIFEAKNESEQIELEWKTGQEVEKIIYID